HFLFQSRHRLGNALDRKPALPLLRRIPRAGADVGSAFSRPNGDGKSPDASGRMEKTGLRRSHFTVLQDFETRSHRTPVETELRFHFHSHHGGVGDENFSARVRTDHKRPSALSRSARQDRKSTRLNSSHVAISYAV